MLFVWTGRCRKLLESGKYDAIYIHGLGAAVDRAINIALQLKLSSVGCVAPLEVSANTSTIDLIDDFIPVDDEHEAKTRSRRSSAVHIKVFHARPGPVSEATAGTQSQKAVCAVPGDSSEMPADERTASGNLEPRQQRAVSRLQRKSKKKASSSETPSS